MTTIETIDLETASIEQMMAAATRTQIRNSEKSAAAAMALLRDPVPGAREIVFAGELRAKLRRAARIRRVLTLHTNNTTP